MQILSIFLLSISHKYYLSQQKNRLIKIRFIFRHENVRKKRDLLVGNKITRRICSDARSFCRKKIMFYNLLHLLKAEHQCFFYRHDTSFLFYMARISIKGMLIKNQICATFLSLFFKRVLKISTIS